MLERAGGELPPDATASSGGANIATGTARAIAARNTNAIDPRPFITRPIVPRPFITPPIET